MIVEGGCCQSVEDSDGTKTGKNGVSLTRRFLFRLVIFGTSPEPLFFGFLQKIIYSRVNVCLFVLD